MSFRGPHLSKYLTNLGTREKVKQEIKLQKTISERSEGVPGKND
jgi:hypothetical protein